MAAIFAMGKPVAFEASAEERETRGFISMTTMRPVLGSTANWTFEPPVSSPRKAFWKDSAKVRPIAITSPTDFI